MNSGFRIFYQCVGLKSLKHLMMFKKHRQKQQFFFFCLILFFYFCLSGPHPCYLGPYFQHFKRSIFLRDYFTIEVWKDWRHFDWSIQVFKNIFISKNCKNWLKLRRCWKQIINQYWSDATSGVYARVCLLSDLKLKFNNIDYWFF